VRRSLFALGLALALLPSGAWANGRYPAANQVVVAPSDPKALLLRATFGFLLSRDGGAAWDWVCEDAVGYAGQQDPSVGITAAGSLLSGSFEGLAVSLDGGCGWNFASGGLQNVVDLAVRPDRPHEALAVTNAYAGATDAGNVFRSQLWATTDDGTHWAALGAPLDPSLVLVTLEVAPSDPERVYLSGRRGPTHGGQGFLLISRDGGSTFGAQPVVLDPATETAPFLAAVDPSNADVVYLRTDGTPTSRLLVTHDAGQTFATEYTGGPMLGFALSPDGSKAYLGGTDDGLRVASTADYVFRQTSTVPVQCLRASGDTLLVCSDELSAGFTLGASLDDGVTIVPRLHVANVRGPLACSPVSSTALCAKTWPALEQQLGIPAAPTAEAGPSRDAAQAADAESNPATQADADEASDRSAAEEADATRGSPGRAGKPSCACGAAGDRRRETDGPVLALCLSGVALRRTRATVRRRARSG
jgi:photosystem II stability/assembly factor-like uncharacterized protein